MPLLYATPFPRNLKKITRTFGGQSQGDIMAAYGLPQAVSNFSMHPKVIKPYKAFDACFNKLTNKYIPRTHDADVSSRLVLKKQ